MPRTLWQLMAIICAAALIAAGCGETDGGGGDGGDAGGDFSGEMTLGALIPLTGALADFGTAGESAAELALDELNAAAEEAGLEGRATLVVEDTETEEDAANSSAEKLVRTDDVDCIAGAWASTSTIGVAQSVAIDAGVPMISPASTSPDITGIDDDNLLWRVAPSDLLQSQVIAQVMADELDEGATVTPAGINNDYGSAFVDAFSDAAEEVGLSVNDPVLYDPAGTQFDAEAEQIVDGSPDAWLIVDYPDQAYPRLGPALVRTGEWSPDRTFTTDGLRSPELPADLGEELTEGMRGSAAASPESDAAGEFDELWTSSDVGDRQTYDAHNFDAVVLCYLAAVAAGSTDGDAMAAELQAVASAPGEVVTIGNLAEGIQMLLDGEDINYEGASGPIEFDDNGDPASATYDIWAYQDGELVTLSQTSFGGDEDAMMEETSEDDAMMEETDAG